MAQAKAKDPPNDALPDFAKIYSSYTRVGTLLKESHTGKLIQQWEKTLSELKNKPELVDMSPAVSFFMAIKDEDEMVSHFSFSSANYVQLNHRIESDTYRRESHFHTACTQYSAQTRDDLRQRSRHHPRCFRQSD
jgi:nucleosome binding factor SPN SPT16 subunit